MSRKLLTLSFGLILVLAVALVASTGDRQTATRLAVEDIQILQTPSSQAACNMVKHSNAPGYFWSGYEAGTGTYTYFNPEVECGSPTYPFEITDFSFTLYTGTWPVNVDVVVRDMAVPSDSCAGPGQELCRYSLVVDEATYAYPNIGTFTFPSPCCVTGPFFIGLEYTAGTQGSIPSMLYDSESYPADACDCWMVTTDGFFHEWNNFWTPPPSGYPLFQVDGETVSQNCLDCDWRPGDSVKMHFPQLPDETGWDVGSFVLPLYAADDWMCTETGWVKDIHFWGSWYADGVAPITGFELYIYSNNPGPPSMPYELLWSDTVTDFTTYQAGSGQQGWYDPMFFIIEPNNHQLYFQYNICLDSVDWFWQEQDSIYWLCVQPIPHAALWGWKTTQNHFMDKAVWSMSSPGTWVPLSDPLIPDSAIDLAFVITGEPPEIMPWDCTDNPPLDKVGGGPETEPNNSCQEADTAACETAYCGSIDQTGDEDWWVIDLPDDTCYCLHVRVFGNDTPNQYAYGQGLDPTLTIYAEDCSTELYFNDDYNGTFPDAEGYDSQYDCSSCDNSHPPGTRLYIKVAGWSDNSIGPYLLIINCDTSECMTPMPEGTLNLHNTDGFVPLAGNPIGTQWHELWPTYSQTWDLTSWIDNGDGILSVSDSLDFNGDPAKYHVEWIGPTIKIRDLFTLETSYLDYNDFDNPRMDPITDPAGTVWHEVWPAYSAIHCITTWYDNGNGYLDSSDVVEFAEYPVTPYEVLEVATDIILTGGDPWPDHKMHFPQLPDEAGWDVKASPAEGSLVQFIADDWMCSQTGWVKDIHFWGSWKNGNVGPVLGYNLRIYSDIPFDPDSVPYSRPGDVLWDKLLNPSVTPIDPQTMEGWYDPYTGEILPNNHQQYFQYDVLLDSTDWFFQDSGRVYWLAIFAIPMSTAEWGWKSSLDHWNDNAVMEFNLSGEWMELQEPPAGGPLDMAFVITGEPADFVCDCLPGDANNSGSFNILDVTYCITYLYKGGPGPTPYLLCAGDPNCDCKVNILDVTYMINYLYKGGPPPCSCSDWVNACGLTLRK